MENSFPGTEISTYRLARDAQIPTRNISVFQSQSQKKKRITTTVNGNQIEVACCHKFERYGRDSTVGLFLYFFSHAVGSD